MLYWQLNNEWPGASKSSLEDNGVWKLLHYAAVRFYSPLHVSAVYSSGAGSLTVHIANDGADSLQPNTTTVAVAGLDVSTSASLTCQEFPVPALPAASGLNVYVGPVADICRGASKLENCAVLAGRGSCAPKSSSWPLTSGSLVESVTHPLHLVKAALQPADLQVTVVQTFHNTIATLEVSSNVTALWVTLEVDSPDSYAARFSDNGVLVHPSHSFRVNVTWWEGVGRAAPLPDRAKLLIHSINNFADVVAEVEF